MPARPRHAWPRPARASSLGSGRRARVTTTEDKTQHRAPHISTQGRTPRSKRSSPRSTTTVVVNSRSMKLMVLSRWGRRLLQRATWRRGRRRLRRRRSSAKRKHSKNGTFYDSLNFDAPHRANARTHAQAETANRLFSLCSIGSSKENHPKS